MFGKIKQVTIYVTLLTTQHPANDVAVDSRHFVIVDMDY